MTEEEFEKLVLPADWKDDRRAIMWVINESEKQAIMKESFDGIQAAMRVAGYRYIVVSRLMTP